jgi:hypothetical protein
MRLHVHQTLSALPIIPFAAAGMIAGAYLADQLGLWRGDGATTVALRRVAALALMLSVGWVCSLPAQYAYDRLVPAHCPNCGNKAAYRRWPSIRRYRCPDCRTGSTA